jgi:hypothetical protein
MLGLGAAARQPNAQAGARGQIPSQGNDIFNRLVQYTCIHMHTFLHINSVIRCILYTSAIFSQSSGFYLSGGNR